MKVSIIIPVYNEAAYLAACLDAIARQTVRPLEVIVVDNNSTDATVSIAQNYDFVTLLHEPRQGVVYARDRGFNAARGDIIGRIDADTLLATNWVATVTQTFTQQPIAALSGSASYYDMGLAPILNTIDAFVRRYLAVTLGKDVALQGANMAVRRSAWLAIRGKVCHDHGMHEDLDLSIHLARGGHTVKFVPSVAAGLSYRRVASPMADFAAYHYISPRTYAAHGIRSKVYFYPMVAWAISGYPILRLLHSNFDTRSRRLTFNRLLQTPAHRVNPALYVD